MRYHRWRKCWSNSTSVNRPLLYHKYLYSWSNRRDSKTQSRLSIYFTECTENSFIDKILERARYFEWFMYFCILWRKTCSILCAYLPFETQKYIKIRGLFIRVNTCRNNCQPLLTERYFWNPLKPLLRLNKFTQTYLSLFLPYSVLLFANSTPW